MDIDKRTGRPFGDHGTGADAIWWVLHVNRDGQEREFLNEWECGAAYEEWPEFYQWLKDEGR